MKINLKCKHINFSYLGIKHILKILINKFLKRHFTSLHVGQNPLSCTFTRIISNHSDKFYVCVFHQLYLRNIFVLQHPSTSLSHTHIVMEKSKQIRDFVMDTKYTNLVLRLSIQQIIKRVLGQIHACKGDSCFLEVEAFKMGRFNLKSKFVQIKNQLFYFLLLIFE